jgi:hypothetical protein
MKDLATSLSFRYIKSTTFEITGQLLLHLWKMSWDLRVKCSEMNVHLVCTMRTILQSVSTSVYGARLWWSNTEDWQDCDGATMCMTGSLPDLHQAGIMTMVKCKMEESHDVDRNFNSYLSNKAPCALQPEPVSSVLSNCVKRQIINAKLYHQSNIQATEVQKIIPLGWMNSEYMRWGAQSKNMACNLWHASRDWVTGDASTSNVLRSGVRCGNWRRISKQLVRHSGSREHFTSNCSWECDVGGRMPCGRGIEPRTGDGLSSVLFCAVMKAYCVI